MARPYQCRCCHHRCIIVVQLTRSRGVAAFSSSVMLLVQTSGSRSIVGSQPARAFMVDDAHGYVTISRAHKCLGPLQTTPIAAPSCTTFLGSTASRAFRPSLSAPPPAVAPILPNSKSKPKVETIQLTWNSATNQTSTGSVLVRIDHVYTCDDDYDDDEDNDRHVANAQDVSMPILAL
jgi:hypothetical protein